MENIHKNLDIDSDMSECSVEQAIEELAKITVPNDLFSYDLWLECNILQRVAAAQIALAVECIEGVKVHKYRYDQSTWRVVARHSERPHETSVGSPGA